MRIGDEEDRAEVWLGTEHDNDPAIALYRSTRGAEALRLHLGAEAPYFAS